MGFFPTVETQPFRDPEDVPRLRQTNEAHAIYAARVDMRLVHATTACSAFTNATGIGASVTIPVASTTNFRVGDALAVGGLVGYYRTGTVTTNPVSFTAYRRGSYVTATLMNAGQYVIVPGSSTWTTTTGTFSVPETFNQTTGTANVATPANVPSNSVVAISNRAGVFRITAIGAGTLTATMIAPGEVPFGVTVPATECSSGALMGITKWGGLDNAGNQWAPTDLWVACIAATSGASPSGATISLGWAANTAAGVEQLSQFVDSGSLVTSATLTANNYRAFALRAQHGERTCAPQGHPIMLRVKTASTSSIYTCEWIVRGFNSE